MVERTPQTHVYMYMHKVYSQTSKNCPIIPGGEAAGVEVEAVELVMEGVAKVGFEELLAKQLAARGVENVSHTYILSSAVTCI